jgi:hypothetical protein
VRRDNCLLVKNLVTECLHKILIDRDIPGAVQYVKNTISDLLMNIMDLSLLVIKEDQTLCSHCKGREAELYQKTVANVRELEMLFGKLWTQCQWCQGSLHQDVLCTSHDYLKFYHRKKAQKDLTEAEVQLEHWKF